MSQMFVKLLKIVAGSALTLYAISRSIFWYRSRHLLNANATITGQDCVPFGSRILICIIKVEFELNGTQQETAAMLMVLEPFQIGSTIKIMYDPKDPLDVKFVNIKGSWCHVSNRKV